MSIRQSNLLVFLLALLVLFMVQLPAAGQSNWSTYERIPGFSDRTEPPLLVADTNHFIHAFTSQWLGDVNPQLGIVYSRWSLDTGWSPPVDILLSPLEQARMMGALLDDAGNMHVVFFGGDDRYADIYYSHSPTVSANNARSWSFPVAIGKNAIVPSSAAMAGDRQQFLLTVYSGRIDENSGYYFILSSDSGKTWSSIEPLFISPKPDLSPYGISLFEGKSGIIHAVWNLVDVHGHNISAYYAGFDIQHRKWSDPVELIGGVGIDEGMGISNQAVIEYKGQIMVMYNNGIPPTGVPPSQYYRTSTDGKSWSIPIRPFGQHVGRNGVISFVEDSIGGLHVLFADRIPVTIRGSYAAYGGIYHSEWKGDHWSEPEPVAERLGNSGQLVDGSETLFGPYDVRAAIGQGNVILATWRTDPGSGENGVWYAYKKLDLPELPVTPLPTIVEETSLGSPTDAINGVPQTRTATSTQISKLNSEDLNKVPFANMNPGSTVFIALVPALVIIIAAFLFGIIKRAK